LNELAEINEMLIDGHDKDEDDSDDSNSGTLLMDATCTPADIAFPQDINLITGCINLMQPVLFNKVNWWLYWNRILTLYRL
jgi:hypothetical protein